MTALPSTEDLARLAALSAKLRSQDPIPFRSEIAAEIDAIREVLDRRKAEAGMRQWPDPLTSDMARAVEQHRESLLVEIMSMFDKMQRELDYSRGGKLGPVDPPQPSETVAAVERAFDKIRELNMSGRDENGHRWANSDLIDQTVTEGLFALRALKGGAA